MINITIAFDEKDTKLGKYFEDCKNQLINVLIENYTSTDYTLNEIPSMRCNNVYIDTLISDIKPNPFIFIAYSHGDEKALYCNSNYYIKCDVNTHYFANTIFYTTACLAGKELGENLIANGCLAFVGYNNVTYVFMENSKKEISRNCDNIGIISFLSEDITIFEAFKKMKNYYEQQIDKYNLLKDPIFAGNLVEAREALVFIGNRNIKKEDISF